MGFCGVYKEALCGTADMAEQQTMREHNRVSKLQGNTRYLKGCRSALLKSGQHDFVWLDNPGTLKHGVGTSGHSSLVRASTCPVLVDAAETASPSDAPPSH